MKALLLNGPPRSGKDTIGGILSKAIPGGVLRKFATPIVVFMKNEFGIDMAAVEKDEPHQNLLGQTPRQVAIQYSEGFCKPLWGNCFFGHAAFHMLRDVEAGGVPIFTDSGFINEAEALLEHGMKLLQIRLQRPGCSYDGDSRSTWDHPSIEHLTFFNDPVGVDNLIKKIHRDLMPRIVKWLTQS